MRVTMSLLQSLAQLTVQIRLDLCASSRVLQTLLQCPSNINISLINKKRRGLQSQT